jgi:hypothetical protein
MPGPTRARWLLLVGVVLVVALGAAVIVRVSTDSGAATGPAVPTFVDAAATAGIDHRYDGGSGFFVGGGVAAFDCTGDGLPELFIAGGEAPAALFRNDSTIGDRLRFTRLPSTVTDLSSVTGAYPIDIDGDDLVDLVVLRKGEDVLLRGLGSCTFERANERFGFDGGDSWTVAFSATWEGANALPTMAFGDYRSTDGDGCAESRLFRPTEQGDEYASPIALAPGYCTLSMLFSDWQRTGQRDLRLANDRNYYRDGTEQLWRVVPGQPPVLYGEADGWRPLQIWGMGIASQDLTGDGLPEVFLTSQADNKLQTLVSGATGPTYEDIALRLGVTAHRPFAGEDVLPSTAWHPEFQDVNNDGEIDLFITKGNVEAEPGYALADPNNLLLGRPDGTFVEAAQDAGILDDHRSRGAALVDLDGDGLLDLVVVERTEDVRVWHNLGAGDGEQAAPLGNAAAIRLHQPGPNVDAIGAWLDVRVGDRVVSREVTIGGGHAGGQLGWIHVGFGSQDQVEIRVQWPDGETGPWIQVAAGARVTLERGAPAAVPWSPSADGSGAGE